MTVKDAILLAAKYAAKKSPKRLLECVHFLQDCVVGDDHRATIYVPAKVPEELVGVSAPAALLAKALAVYDDPKFSVTETSLVVKEGKRSSRIRIMGPGDYDRRHDLSQNWEELPEDLIWSDFAGAVVHAVSSDETRAGLNGISCDGSHITATDGHRMARVRDEGLPKFKHLLPKAVASLPFDPKRVAEAAGTVYFQGEDGTVLCGPVLQDTPPDYRNVIPKLVPRFEVDRAEFLAEVQQIHKQGLPLLELTHDGDTLDLKARNKDRDMAFEDSISVDGKRSQKLTWGLNTEYLLDALSNGVAERVSVTLNDSLSPLMVSPVDDPEAEIFVVMPHRL